MRDLYFLLLLFVVGAQAQEPMSIEVVQKQLDSIQISEIKTPCDCCDGMEKIAAILVITTERFYNKQQVENDPYGSMIIKLTNQKTGAVAQKCQSLGFKDSDIFECESFVSLEENSKLLNQKFRN